MTPWETQQLVDALGDPEINGRLFLADMVCVLLAPYMERGKTMDGRRLLGIDGRREAKSLSMAEKEAKLDKALRKCLVKKGKK